MPPLTPEQKLAYDKENARLLAKDRYEDYLASKPKTNWYKCLFFYPIAIVFCLGVGIALNQIVISTSSAVGFIFLSWLFLSKK